jgi:hypothetical protein
LSSHDGRLEPAQAFPEPFRPRTWLHANRLSEATLAAAWLIRLEQHLTYTSQLVSYLVAHPTLLWFLGFPLVPDKSHPLGFKPAASLPSQRQFNRCLRQMEQASLQWLLDPTVARLRRTLEPFAPDFGDIISLGTKHILTFVKENNPKAYVPDRFNKTKQPPGDPDTDRTRAILVHERARYVCPLCFPAVTGTPCPIQHNRWAEGGCTVDMPTSIGARLRYQLDRPGDAYKAIYKQRTATERLFSQAVALGIERPCLRNGQAITNLNTLIYILLNLRTLLRCRQNAETLTP